MIANLRLGCNNHILLIFYDQDGQIETKTAENLALAGRKYLY